MTYESKDIIMSEHSEKDWYSDWYSEIRFRGRDLKNPELLDGDVKYKK